MKLESRNLQSTQVRHLKIGLGPKGPCVAWWHGAVIKNHRTKSLPHVAVWCRNIRDGNTLGEFFRADVGITDLGLVQVGTIWEGKTCKTQIALEKKVFSVNFSKGNWSLSSQSDHFKKTGRPLIPESVYPLRYPLGDRSQILEFRTDNEKRLLVPCLEFFSRFYGRSGHVTRVLATYPWDEAEGRLFVPFEYPATPGHWPIKLASSTYNADAVFLAHVKHDPFALLAAKSVYSTLDAQYKDAGSKAFLEAEPWFQGPAKVVVEGHWLDNNTFLALRIVGGSEPAGPDIDAFRENPGKALESAPDGAPLSNWPGRLNLKHKDNGLVVNLTPDDEPGSNGNIEEIHNPAFYIVGRKRDVIRHRLPTATTRPGIGHPHDQAEKHSPAERHGSTNSTGVASIHTKNILLSSGAVKDVWNGLRYFRKKLPEFITALGWYNSELGRFVLEDGEDFQLVALKEYDADERIKIPTSDWKWVYRDPKKMEPRGVLVALVQTTGGSACLFEIDRRVVNRKADDGTISTNEEKYSGLVLVPPKDRPPSEWIAEVLGGIRRECGIMKKVLSWCPPGADFYHRSPLKNDVAVGYWTVINALSKVDIDLVTAEDQQVLRAKSPA